MPVIRPHDLVFAVGGKPGAAISRRLLLLLLLGPAGRDVTEARVFAPRGSVSVFSRFDCDASLKNSCIYLLSRSYFYIQNSVFNKNIYFIP